MSPAPTCARPACGKPEGQHVLGYAGQRYCYDTAAYWELLKRGAPVRHTDTYLPPTWCP